jgi:phosphate transport system substrate-binding protein
LKGKFLSNPTFVADCRNRQPGNKKQTKLCYVNVIIIASLLVIFSTGCAGLGSTTSPTLSGHLLAKGSTALQPLVTAAAAIYQRQHPQVKIDVEGGGSLTGLNTVTGYKANIGDSDVYADPAQYPDPNLTDHIVCVIPFTMVVNLDVPVHSLTTQQIIDIFSTSTIRNWSQVGGPDLPIVPIVRPPTSGTRATFRKYILGGRDENGRLQKTDSSQSILNVVEHTPGAISYLALSVANASVHAIAINNEMATPENIANGSYAYWGYEHMYTMGDNNTLISSFLDFMLTPEIQNLAQRMHYIPIADMNLSTAGTANSSTTTLSPALAAIRESEVSYRES